MKRVLVVGAGAVGIYYGLILHKAGFELCFCCRSDYEVAKQQGFVLHHQDSQEHYLLSVIRDVHDYLQEGAKPDVILIATKALPEIDLVSLLAPVVGKETCFLMIQNGLGIEKALAKKFPDHLLLT
eukprot:COSAG01_NODE_48769_length_378_cov_0.731183_1_plen_125_part_11